jgi:hypothetical protein
LQETLTAKLYQGVAINENVVKLEPAQFEEKYVQEISNYSYPEEYNGFYDGREIAEIDVDAIASTTQPAAFSKNAFDNIFNEENATFAVRIAFIEADIETVKAIREENSQVKTFDFDGEKYTRQEAEQVLEKLSGQLEQLKKQQQEADEKAFQFFYAIALQQGAAEKFKHGYAQMFASRKEDQVFFNESNKLLQVIQPLYSGEQLTEQTVIEVVTQLKKIDEIRLKNNLRQLSREGIFDSNAEYTNLANKFINSNYLYYTEGNFFGNEFDELRRLIFEGSGLLAEFRFSQIKELLEQQADMIPQ